MQCPVCKDISLVMTERQNVEIDYCPQCRGVWLDRGELDKIIERSQQQESRFLPAGFTQASQELLPQAEVVYSQPSGGHQGDKHGSKHGSKHGGHSEVQSNHSGGWRDTYQSGHQGQPYRKKSFLRELFD
ncbi:hypothetical protein BWR59_19845 [Pseudomonas sp. Bc-h]|uniref:TFIIB-type zinc ribbon-containing protein n=1 Tax=Pseudomonas sp. Bc-h TaxID=1943632 RepID=UPI0009DAE3F0|nr:hypothetical protein BWR59_19845 [Pseudomonas sp. Bc-h]